MDILGFDEPGCLHIVGVFDFESAGLPARIFESVISEVDIASAFGEGLVHVDIEWNFSLRDIGVSGDFDGLKFVAETYDTESFHTVRIIVPQKDTIDMIFFSEVEYLILLMKVADFGYFFLDEIILVDRVLFLHFSLEDFINREVLVDPFGFIRD